MSRSMENIATLNSLLRTILGFTVVVGLGAIGYWGYSVFTADDRLEDEFQSKLAQKDQDYQLKLAKQDDEFQSMLADQKEEFGLKLAAQDREFQLNLAEKDEVIGEQQQQIAKQGEEIEKLATSLRLLTVNHRLAQVTVLDVVTDPETGKTESTIEFVELSPSGTPIEDKPRIFKISGEVFYIDAWLVKFEDKYIQDADLQRGTSLCLFRRIFGENQEPNDGFELDPNGSQPNTYARGGKISELEQQIWSNFWEIANDSARTKGLGIRSIHGEAVSKKAVKGKRYIVELRASAGLDFVTTSEADARENKPSA